MSDTATKPPIARKLQRLMTAMASAAGETLVSLASCDLKITPADVTATDSKRVLEALDGESVVIRAALDKDFSGRTLRIRMAAQDATALVGKMTMADDDTIAAKRQAGVLDRADRESFAEVCNVLCSTIHDVLVQAVKHRIGLRLESQGMLRTGEDVDGLLGEEDFVALNFDLAIGDLPATQMQILLDADTAERWNGEPIELQDDIPQAPIRGKLAAYVVDQETLRAIRNCCRRVGLELDRHGRSEIPNPAAHRGEIVLIDIPAGEPRRYDWCTRLKEYDAGIRVVLMIRHPSRNRVYQGFKVGADVIVGWPITEQQLLHKLDALLPPVEPAPETEPPAAG